jgi:hypothetical protein
MLAATPPAPRAGAAEGDDDRVVTTPSTAVAAGRGLSIELTYEKATIDLGAVRGGWDGAVLGVAWRSSRIGARATMPFYIVDAGTYSTEGLGDAFVETQVAAIARAPIAAGVGLGMSLPSGDATEGRGMGHVMVMPGLWVATRRGRVDASMVASLAHAIGSDGQHVHHHATVNVNPMSPVEVAATARFAVRATRGLSPRVGSSIALPIDSDSDARASMLVGLAWRRRAWQVAADLELPVLGNAFDARATMQIARWF